MISIICSILSLLLAIAALGAKSSKECFTLTFCSHAGTFLSLFLTGHFESSKFYLGSIISLSCVYFVGIHLLNRLEKTLNLEICEDLSGLTVLFPQQSGLYLFSVYLMGLAPGSLLFIFEDLAISHIMDQNIFAGLMVIVAFGFASIALYKNYVYTFSGTVPPQLHKSFQYVEEPKLLWQRLLFFCVVGIGILPRIIL